MIPLAPSHSNSLRPTWLVLLASALVAGCAQPLQVGETVPETDAQPPPPSVIPWSASVQRTLGVFAGWGTPVTSGYYNDPAYCKEMDLLVPPGTAHLNLTFVQPAAAGPIGSESGTGWLILNAGSPSSRSAWQGAPAAAEQSVSLEKPEPGLWKLKVIAMGAAVKQTGNLTIEMDGLAAKPPSLMLTMLC